MQRHGGGLGDAAILRPQKRFGQIAGGRYRRGAAQPLPPGLPAGQRILPGLGMHAAVVFGFHPGDEQPVELQQRGGVVDPGGSEVLAGRVGHLDQELFAHGAEKSFDLCPGLGAGRVPNAPGAHRVSRTPATATRHRMHCRYPRISRPEHRGRPAPGAMLRPAARCLRRSRTGSRPPAGSDRRERRTGRFCGRQPAARAARRRTTARWGRRPRTGRTPPRPPRRLGPSTPAGGNGAAGSTPRAPTRWRCAGSGPPAPRCGWGSPASATPPAPAPARRYARPAAAARAPAPRTRRSGSGGSSGPASPARCAPGCRTGRHGCGRRSHAPAFHAACWTTPRPAPGRSADTGITRSPAPAPGACAPPMTPDSSPLQSKALPGETVAGQVPSRGSPIIVRSGRGDWCCIAAIRQPRPAGRQQPTTASRSRHPRRRHRAEQPGRTEPEPDRRGRGRHRGQRVPPRTANASGIPTSTPAVTATVRNNARTASSRCAARRSQPRTVAAGTPRLTPIRRCPDPSARAVNAAQIRSAAYALRSNTVTGNNTCVARQLRHRARRGRTESANPSIHRERA